MHFRYFDFIHHFKVLEGLEYLHEECQIIHTDIKPGYPLFTTTKVALLLIPIWIWDKVVNTKENH